ncbi:vasopressin V2 receptor-like [Oratosquilla oratoria]|uniref:vasopressin V2 receptor-like n=1 Tax=Oratosquilla oratoria TaxID=337810 RepID=UPI003F76301E
MTLLSQDQAEVLDTLLKTVNSVTSCCSEMPGNALHMFNVTMDEITAFGNETITLSDLGVPNATEWPASSLSNESGTPILTSTHRVPHGYRMIEYSNVWTGAVIQRLVTLLVLMALSLAGNLTVLGVLLASSSPRRRTASRVNVFIAHLALGDLAVCLFTMTGEIFFEVFGEWVLGAAACKLVTYAEIVTLSSSTFLLTAMSWDRYCAICRPLQYTATRAHRRKLIWVAWGAAFVVAVPYLFIFVQTLEGFHPDGRPVYACRSQGYTQEWQRKLSFTCLTLYILVLPTFVIAFSYASIVKVVFKQGKEQRAHPDGSTILRKATLNSNAISRAKLKTVKMTLCIILTFVVCWVPYFVVHNIRIWSGYTYQIPKPVIVLAETAALANSAVNPLLYGCFTLNLRQGLAEVCCRRRRSRPHGCPDLNVAFSSSASHSSAARGSPRTYTSTAVVRYRLDRDVINISLPSSTLCSHRDRRHQSHSLQGTIPLRPPPLSSLPPAPSCSCSLGAAIASPSSNGDLRSHFKEPQSPDEVRSSSSRYRPEPEGAAQATVRVCDPEGAAPVIKTFHVIVGRKGGREASQSGVSGV